MNVTCSAEPCPVILNATCVFYEGNTLVYTGIVTNDNLQTALQKIDQKFQDSNLGYIFTNGLEQLAPGQPVMLGGALVKNTTIGGLYNLAFAGTLEASALITTGGTSTDFVKGDGSLDPTSYQPSGNYISNLTGDVIANGPGSVTATLATVFGAPGTYGNSGSIPSITVDGKGRVTNVTPTPINYPAQSLSFVGDVDGFGFTGSPVTLTLDTVNTDVYGSNNFLKFAVNGKGLITSATPVSGGDITTALGYVPVNDAIELSINGVAHDLTANRSWNVGTVTSVSITAGTGINASISNPNSTPSISIINTAPDQTVVLNGGFGISVTGSYPNFTVINDYPSLGGTVTSFSAGNLSPLFTTSVASSTTTPALSFALANAAANRVFAGPNGGSGAPSFRALVAADIPSLSYISNISATAPLATTGGLTPTLSISQADASTNGYLSSADWNTFSSKQPAGNYITDITGDATASGPGSACLTFATVNATAGTFGSSTQVPVITVNGKGLVTCVTTSNISGSLEFIGDVTGIGSTGTCTSLTLATVNNDVYTSETLLNIAVNGKGLITSANPTTAGDICSTLGYTPEDVANKSTCTSLGSSNTLYPTQLAVKTYVDSATAGGIILQGDWNAATNTPDITGTTTTGFAWRVSVDGTTNLGGINDWQVGDLAVKSATGWVKIDNSDGVTSVFGRFGAVVATTGDYLTCQVTECGNLYYTDARVRAAVGHTAPLTYCSTTGVFGISQSNTTTDGYLSATDWTTFNDKQPALGYTPVNQTRQLTINGTTHDLSADRTWNVGTVTSVTGSAPLASSGGATPNLTISQAGAASDGFLSSTDWNTFNSKTSCLGTVTNVAACTSTTGVSITGSPITSSGTLGINVSTASTVCTGLLTAADWNTFNNKTSCTGTVTSVGLTSSTTGVTIGSSPITSSGNITLDIATASATCTGLLTSADWNTFNSHTSCTGTVTCVNATGTNISVTGGPITTSGTLAISLSGANVCSALGYTPYNATNPNGYTSCVGTVTSAGIVATNINVCNSPVTTSGNICLNLTGANVCSALGYSPVSPSTLSGYVPYTGATTSVNLGANNITAQNYLSDGNGSTTGGYLGFKQYSSTFNGQQGYTSIYALSQSSLYIRYSQLDLSSRTVDLSAALLGTTGRQYLFPDKNGTFAMTNDIPANPVGGTGTTNYLPKFTGTSTIGNSQIFDNGTNVGIGTINPTAATINRETLVIRGTSSELILQSSNATDGTSQGFGLVAAGNDAYFVNRLDGFYSWITGGSGNTERMRLDASGNLGLGITSPLARLHILGDAYPLIIASNSATTLYTIYKYNTTTDVGYIGNGVGAITGGAASDFGIAAATGNLLFASGGVTERMRITSGGNVGIGTTSPNGKMTVVGNTVDIRNGAGGYGTGYALEFSTNATIPRIDLIDNGVYTGNIKSSSGIVTLQNSSNNALAFGTNNTERMRITSGGDVCVGVTSSTGFWPANLTQNAAKQIIQYNDSTTNLANANAGLVILNSNTTAGTSSKLVFGAYNTDPVAVGLAYISAVNSTRSSGYLTGDLVFGTSGGGSTGAVERMRIDASGRLLVNRTASTNPSYYLQVTQGISSSTSVVAQGTLTGYSGAGLFMSYESYGGRLESYDYSTSAWKNIAIAPNGGNVGIGTTSPAYKLQIGNASSGFTSVATIASSGAGTSVTNLLLQNTNASETVGTGVNLNFSGVANWLGRINAQFVGSTFAGNANMSFWTPSGGSLFQRMTLDFSGNLGLGVTPSAWSAGRSISVGNSAAFYGDGINYIWSAGIAENAYKDATVWKYVASGYSALRYEQLGDNGTHAWYIAPSGTAGNAISFTQAMTLDASGRLGIGVTSPTTFLDINSGTNPPIIKLTSSAVGQIPFSIRANIPGFSNSGFSIYDETAAASRLVISSTGNVGIGTTSPGRNLSIEGSDIWVSLKRTSNREYLIGQGTSDNFRILDATAGVDRLVIASTGAATFSSTVTATQYTATSTGGSGLRVYGAAGTNQWDMYLNSTNLRFSDNTGTGSVVFDRPISGTSAIFTSTGRTLQIVSTADAVPAVIRANGHAISTLSFQGITSANDFNTRIGCDVNDLVAFTNNIIRLRINSSGDSTFSGTVTASGDITAFSDARVKTNVKTIENALDKVLALRGVSYNRTDSDNKETKIGVIAQETLPVVPEVVNQNDDGMYGVSYGNLGALFIEAIKEQQKQIDELKKQVV